MYGIFADMYHKKWPNVRKYTIHWVSGIGISLLKRQASYAMMTPFDRATKKAADQQAEAQSEIHEGKPVKSTI